MDDLARFGAGAWAAGAEEAAADGGEGGLFFAFRLRRLRAGVAVDVVEIDLVVAVVAVVAVEKLVVDGVAVESAGAGGFGGEAVLLADVDVVVLKPEGGGKAEPLMSLAVERVTLRGGMNK